MELVNDLYAFTEKGADILRLPDGVNEITLGTGAP